MAPDISLNNIVVAFTGHRPNKLGGYSTPNPMYNYIEGQITDTLIQIKPRQVISGMALGVDQWAAEVCIKLGIPFLAAIPFRGQELYWPPESRKKYFELLDKAASVEFVNPGSYASWKMQSRNEWMVNHCDVLIAVFDGTPGGTKNCFDYAVDKEKKIIRINPKDFKG